MKKRNFKNIIILLTVCALMLPVLAACSSMNLAEECVQWTVSEDGKTLSDGEKSYALVADGGVQTETTTAYEYYNEVSLPIEGFDFCMVYGPHADSEYVWVYNGYSSVVFATAKGLEDIKEFKNGNISYYRMKNQAGESADMSVEDVRQMQDAYRAQELVKEDITELGHRTRYDIEAIKGDKGLSYACGSVYLINNVWYYLDHGSLGAEFFDENGTLLYRDGEVMIAPLSAELGKNILDYESNLLPQAWDNTYEAAAISEELSEQDSAVFGVVVIVIMIASYFVFGYIVPMVIFALGMILPNMKKLGKPKYWYVISALAAIWILLSILFALILLVAIIIAA